MALQGIDISNWQAGIDLSRVPCDFVIAKATEGTGYVSPDCSRQVEQARSLGKLFGTYHYITGVGAKAEVDHYLSSISNWIGEGLLCLDWESGGNSAWGNPSYLRACAERVIEKTGIPPVIYVSKASMAASQQIASDLNCALWVAQYASNDPTGYQDTPWNEGAYQCAIRQYTSAGRLNGWSGNLDLNKFYGDRSAWFAIAGAKEEDMTDEQAKMLKECHHQLTRTDDPTGRGACQDFYVHLKFIAGAIQDINAKLAELEKKIG